MVRLLLVVCALSLLLGGEGLAAETSGLKGLLSIWNRDAEKKARERERALKEQAELDTARRAEDRARAEKFRKERERKIAEREAKLKAARLKEAAGGTAQRFKDLLSAFRGAEVDYFKFADDSDNPSKAGAGACFVCLLPGGGSGCELYEVRTKANAPMETVRLAESGKSEPIEMADFDEKLKKSPWLIMRDRGIGSSSHSGFKAYFSNVTRGRRGFRNAVPVPAPDSKFSPSKEEFGALYEVMRSLGCSTIAFKYKVTFKGDGLADPVFVKEVGFGEELGRNVFRDAVRKALEATSGGRAVADGEVDRVLDLGRVVFTPKR